MRGRVHGLRCRRYLAVAGAVAAAVSLTAGAGSAQDAQRGAHVFKRCALCHVTDPTAKDLLAPPLHDIVGRPAAQIAGFQYSDIMKYAGKQGLVWTEQALFHFLGDPEGFMPGTYMAFSGLEDGERRDVLAYLAKITSDWKREQEAKARGSKAEPIPMPAWRTLPATPSAAPSRPAAAPTAAAPPTDAGAPVSPPPPVPARRPQVR